MSLSLRTKFIYPFLQIVFVICLFLFHVLWEYHLEKSKAEQALNSELNQLKDSLTSGLKQFQNYLELTRLRIVTAKKNEAVILSAIRLNPTNFTKGILPKILSIEFIPNGEKYFFSRYGKKSLKSPVSLKEKPLWSLDGNEFTYSQTIMDADTLIGMLKTTFTLEPFFKIIETPVQITRESSSLTAFTLQDFPFHFFPNFQTLTFKQFLGTAWFKYMCELLVLLMTVGCTLCLYRFKHYKQLKKLRASNESLWKNLKETKTQSTALKKELDFEKALAKLQKEGLETKNKLVLDFQQRQLEMISQSESILKILDRFLDAEAKEYPILKEAHALSKESQLPLKYLQNRSLFQGEQEPLRVKEVLEKMATIFAADIKKKTLRVSIYNNLEALPADDNLIFELCLYNFFHTSIERLREGGNLNISLSESENFTIRFEDDGYDFDLSTSNLKLASKRELIELPLEVIKQLTKKIGWKITFSQSESKNISELVIPNKSIKKEVPENVVPLFRNQ